MGLLFTLEHCEIEYNIAICYHQINQFQLSSDHLVKSFQLTCHAKDNAKIMKKNYQQHFHQSIEDATKNGISQIKLFMLPLTHLFTLKRRKRTTTGGGLGGTSAFATASVDTARRSGRRNYLKKPSLILQLH